MLRKVKRIKLRKQIYRRLMKRVLERDGWRCQRCGALENLQVHHKIRRSQQGDDALANLVTLCACCHTPEHGPLYYGNARTQASNANERAPSTSEPDNKPWASIECLKK